MPNFWEQFAQKYISVTEKALLVNICLYCGKNEYLNN